ncbi:MAG TPA: hypothetical protein VG389_13300 [Myxococcota bacterium]|nr:hypothetical protein [Myxococcota bacterium]
MSRRVTAMMLAALGAAGGGASCGAREPAAGGSESSSAGDVGAPSARATGAAEPHAGATATAPGIGPAPGLDRVTPPPPPPPGAAPAPAGPALRWAHLWPTPGYELVRGAVATPDGGVVFFGRFEGALATGPVPVASQGASDGFAVKLAGDGSVAWARAIGGTLYDEVLGAAIAPDGTVLLAGALRGRARIGGGAGDAAGEVGTGVDDAPLLLELRPDGTVRGARTLTGGGNAMGVAPAAEGGTVVAGWDLQAGACKDGTAVAGLLAADGRPRWWLCMQSAGFGMLQHVVVDTAGDVAACGTFRLRLELAGQVYWAVAPDFMHVAGGPDQVFVVKISAAGGAVQWVYVVPSDGSARCEDLAALPDGSVALVGSYAGYFDVPRHRAPGDGSDGYVAVVSYGGSLEWARVFPGDGPDAVNGADYAGGALLVSGTRSPGADLGGARSAAAGAFLAALDPVGAVVWATAFSGGDDTFVAAAPDGTVWLAGYTFVSEHAAPPPVDLGGGPLTPAPAGEYDNGDLFAAHFAAPHPLR